MMGRALKSLIPIIAIIIAPLCYAIPNANRLLDIGILSKRDGKAILLIFNSAVEEKKMEDKI